MKLVANKGSQYADLKQELDSYVDSDSLTWGGTGAFVGRVMDRDLHRVKGFVKEVLGEKSEITQPNRLMKGSGEKRANRMREGIEKLPAGKSIIIDAKTLNIVGKNPVHVSGHGMLMRITNNGNDTFKMEFANTGLGIDHDKFHPVSSLEPHKCQTIAVFENLSREQLLASHFFETYCHIANGEDLPVHSCLNAESIDKVNQLLLRKDNANEAIKGRIDALYICLETLGEPTKMPENSDYYSRPQIGGSCSVSP